jgi:hypothetical protein
MWFNQIQTDFRSGRILESSAQGIACFFSAANQDINNESGSAFTMAQYVQNELSKSGTKSWVGFPTPEEMEQLRAERAESDFQQLKWRAAAKDRRHEEMKQALKRILQGGNSNE